MRFTKALTIGLGGKRGPGKGNLQALLFFSGKEGVAVAHLVLGTLSIPVCLLDLSLVIQSPGLEVVSSEAFLKSLTLHYPHNY